MLTGVDKRRKCTTIVVEILLVNCLYYAEMTLSEQVPPMLGPVHNRIREEEGPVFDY